MKVIFLSNDSQQEENWTFQIHKFIAVASNTDIIEFTVGIVNK